VFLGREERIEEDDQLSLEPVVGVAGPPAPIPGAVQLHGVVRIQADGDVSRPGRPELRIELPLHERPFLAEALPDQGGFSLLAFQVPADGGSRGRPFRELQDLAEVVRLPVEPAEMIEGEALVPGEREDPNDRKVPERREQHEPLTHGDILSPGREGGQESETGSSMA